MFIHLIVAVVGLKFNNQNKKIFNLNLGLLWGLGFKIDQIMGFPPSPPHKKITKSENWPLIIDLITEQPLKIFQRYALKIPRIQSN